MARGLRTRTACADRRGKKEEWARGGRSPITFCLEPRGSAHAVRVRSPRAIYETQPMLEARPLLAAVNLHKTYRKHAVKAEVLRGLALEVRDVEFLSVVGASGSGKSTMLHLLGTLDRPDKGQVLLDGRRIDNLPAEGRDALRNRTFGFIFQFYHLLPELNTLEN